MYKKLRSLKRKIFRKRHIYVCYFSFLKEGDDGEFKTVTTSASITSTANPRKIDHETIEKWLREDRGDDTIKVSSYNYQGKW